jgi:hypothetical protein
MTPRSTVRRAVVFLVAAALLGACGTTNTPTPLPITPPPTAGPATPTPLPTASPDPETAMDQIEQEVVAIRELQPKAPVVRSVIDEPKLVELVTTGFNDDNPVEYVEAYGRLLQHLGLMAQGDDLQELYIELLGSQVIGMYDPDTKQLYVVVRDEFGGLAKITFAHEYTHALQDQQFDLNAFSPVQLDQGDRMMALTAVPEGDATLLMTLWATQHMTPEELTEVATVSADPESLAILERMPAILREGLTFPYDAGVLFVSGAWQSGGWDAVNSLYAKPPASTEQVLHPEKYAAEEEPIPVPIGDGVAARLGDGWAERFQDTLGEFQMEIWIRDVGKVDGAVSTVAAAGWGGDRLALYEGPDDAWAVVVETAWDSQGDAREFVTDAGKIATTLDAIGSADVLQRDETHATVVVGSDDAVLGRLANALGLAG